MNQIINSKQQDLVSVVVVTYNSAKTVVETLDSVKNQTYDNLELIVTDDCSKDDTCLVVDRWIQENEGRFSRVCKKYSNINTGPASNGNRGIEDAIGKYIKVMSGDDCLVDNAIERYVVFLQREGIQFCVSNLELFSDDISIPVPESRIASYRRCFELCKEKREDKLKRLAYEYVLLSPGYFYTQDAFKRSGGFDSRFPFSEEVPFAMRVLRAGFDIVPLDEKLVRYRYSGSTLSQHHGKKLGNRRWFEDNRKIYYEYQFPELVKSFRWLKAYSKMVQYEQTNLAYKDGILPRVGGGILCVINPYTYYNMFRKVWGRLRKSRNTSYTQERT